MNKKLIIVESPGKIKSIEKYAGSNYVVCASAGHIVDLAKGGRFGIGVNPLNGFQPKYCLMPEKVQALDNIIGKALECSEIIICTDPDLEGHAIAWHLKEKLSHLGIPIRRAEFSEITQDGINAGLSDIHQLDELKFKAQETRRILDRIFGFMVSTWLMNYHGGKLSAGRVQSVAAKMIVEREEAINSFVPQEYWTCKLQASYNNQLFWAKPQDKITTKEDAEAILAELNKDPNLKITEVKSKTKKESPPPPLTTAKMQQLMSSKYGIDGDRTMEAAQVLYEMGYCTYIRTDSVRVSDTALKQVREYLKSIGFEVPVKPNVFKNKSGQDAHECIRPTNLNNSPESVGLQGDGLKLYSLIYNYFLVSQLKPVILSITEAKFISSTNRLYKSSGKVVQDPGFQEFLTKKLKIEQNISDSLPPLLKGDCVMYANNTFSYEQKFTSPPARFNYASLIKELESNGIGRPSTYATIIKNLESRNYIFKKDDHYIPTDLGNKIVGELSKYFDFMNYDYTANLEDSLDSIAIGKDSSSGILDDFFKKFILTLSKAQLDISGEVCSHCNAPVYTRTSKEGKEYTLCSLHPFCTSSLEKK